MVLKTDILGIGAPSEGSTKKRGAQRQEKPRGLLLFTLAEIAGAPRMALYVLGALLLVARILSAWGLSTSAGLSFGRQSGAGMTLLYMVGTAGLILYSIFLR